MSQAVPICLDIEPSSFLRSLSSEFVVPSSESVSNIISAAVELEYEHYLDELTKSKKVLRYTPIGNRHGGHFEAISLDAILEKQWIDLREVNVAVVVPKGGPCIRFIPPKHLAWEKSTVIDKLKAEEEHVLGTNGIEYESYYQTRPPRILHKSSKTIDKYSIHLWDVALPTAFFTPVRKRFSDPCDCPSECLQSHIEHVWDWAIQFVCRICGKIYFCECFREAISKHLKKAMDLSEGYAEQGWPNRFIKAYERAGFREGICHICRKAPSDVVYCSEMYRNKFIVRYGPYIQRLAVEKDIDDREAEDQLRDLLGIQRSRKWISEIELYNHVRNLLPNERVIHQARPEWLKPQTLDVYVPGLKLGIEYHGLQHYQPVEFFGGEEAFRKNKERDRQKAKICKENHVMLIYFCYDEEVGRQLIKERIRKVRHEAIS